MKSPEVENLGLIEYQKAWDYQKILFDRMIGYRLAGNPGQGYLLFCEHPHVYTLGKHGHKENLLISDEFLESVHASYFHIDRGGDITYHGPGQIVCYPILDLEVWGLGIREYIHRLESSVIRTLKVYGMEAHRLQNITGVWMRDHHSDTDKKICAIGVKASRGITMHGLAFNVNTNLNYFTYINPCGLSDKGVTSMKEQSGEEWPLDEVTMTLLDQMNREFGFGL